LPGSVAIIWPGREGWDLACRVSGLSAGSAGGPVLLKAQKTGAAIFERSLQQSQWRRQIRMTLALMRKKI
jgi:hypothetical protein